MTSTGANRALIASNAAAVIGGSESGEADTGGGSSGDAHDASGPPTANVTVDASSAKTRFRMDDTPGHDGDSMVPLTGRCRELRIVRYPSPARPT
jgi:hypothetical protein